MKQLQETRAETARRRLAALTGIVEDEEAHATEAGFEQGAVPAHAVAAKPLTRRHTVVVLAVLVAAAVLALWWLMSGRPEKIEATPSIAVASATAKTAASAAPAQVVVDVVGKVKRPGIVELPPGSRVVDAVKAAGGVKGKPDLAALNMARVLSDGEQIIVGGPAPAGAAGTGSPGNGAPGAAMPGAVKVNLNVATTEQLDALPGVGPVTAGAIIAWRDEHGRFSRVEELLEVKGIGPATMADLLPLVMV